MSEPEGLFSHSFLSTINYFGEEFSAIHKNEQMSKDSAAALTLSCIFNVSFPHWNDYNPFGEVEDDKITKKTEEVEEKSVKQEEVGSVVSVPRPVKQKLEPEEIEKVLEELKKIARGKIKTYLLSVYIEFSLPVYIFDVQTSCFN